MPLDPDQITLPPTHLRKDIQSGICPTVTELVGMLQVARSWDSFGSPPPPFNRAENDTIGTKRGRYAVQVHL